MFSRRYKKRRNLLLYHSYVYSVHSAWYNQFVCFLMVFVDSKKYTLITWQSISYALFLTLKKCVAFQCLFRLWIHKSFATLFGCYRSDCMLRLQWHLTTSLLFQQKAPALCCSIFISALRCWGTLFIWPELEGKLMLQCNLRKRDCQLHMNLKHSDCEQTT